MLSPRSLDQLSAKEAAEAAFAPPATRSATDLPSYPLRLADIAKLPDMRRRGGDGIYGQSGGFDSGNWWGFA